MKKIIILLTLALVISFTTGCGKIANNWSHTKSRWVGLRRQITLYAYDGTKIKTWEARSQIELDNASARFLCKGKAVNINGTYIIEEL